MTGRKMTMQLLLKYFEGYYGEMYSGRFLDTMTTYLEGRTEDFYGAVALVLPKRYSRSWNKAPGPAEIERHKEEIIDEMPRPLPLSAPPFSHDEDREEKLEVMGEIQRIINGHSGPLAAALAGATDRMAGRSGKGEL